MDERGAYWRDKQARREAEKAAAEARPALALLGLRTRPDGQACALRGAFSRGRAVSATWWKRHPGARWLPPNKAATKAASKGAA